MTAPSAFQPAPRQGEEALERDLRPAGFGDFLGQDALLSPLQLMIQASKERRETLEHLLFSGLPGLGKTSLALALANEIGAPLKVTSGPAMERAKDLVGILSSLEAGSILFIDEIHRLPKVVEEYLYGAMERFCVEFTLDQGVHARLLKLEIQPFTLVGATTREALLSAPFRSRFGQVFRFEPYSPAALELILARSAGILGLESQPEALSLLADHSRGTPRVANRLLRRARDVAQIEGNGKLDQKAVRRSFELMGVDSFGLERTDRRILEALALNEGRPLGLKNLAVVVDEGEDTLECVYEPWLVREGFIARTPQGRILMEAGWKAIGQTPKQGVQPSLDLE
ncbi:MAG: Holliday junction branch migration DNA helicase RuvB [Planctomycetota bacterium]|nr:Holliday junction branch migration DNA helicase RuvB [Planctomycetota bacterium]MDP6940483.1 Holliday junction branch migration DNA helicase RuvB [Planctomycetota bacterium]